MTTTKQPSAAAMDAARELRGKYIVANGQYRQEIIEAVAAIIDRHLEAERQEVREVLRQVWERGCTCTDPDDENWHSKRCRIPAVRALYIKLGGAGS